MPSQLWLISRRVKLQALQVEHEKPPRPAALRLQPVFPFSTQAFCLSPAISLLLYVMNALCANSSEENLLNAPEQQMR